MGQLFTWTCTKQTTNLLVCNWSIFGARMNHMHTWTHKTHHDPSLKETTTFPFIVLFVISHGGYIQMSFCHEIPKFHRCTYKFKIRSFFGIFVEHDLLVS